jgi:hypothetical protein
LLRVFDITFYSIKFVNCYCCVPSFITVTFSALVLYLCN